MPDALYIQLLDTLDQSIRSSHADRLECAFIIKFLRAGIETDIISIQISILLSEKEKLSDISDYSLN